MRRSRTDLVLSRLCCLLFVLITEFVSHLPFKILLSRTHLQRTVAVGNKIEDVLSRIVALENQLDSQPGDIAELRRRDELIRYATVSPTYSMLSSF